MFVYLCLCICVCVFVFVYLCLYICVLVERAAHSQRSQRAQPVAIVNQTKPAVRKRNYDDTPSFSILGHEYIFILNIELNCK